MGIKFRIITIMAIGLLVMGFVALSQVDEQVTAEIAELRKTQAVEAAGGFRHVVEMWSKVQADEQNNFAAWLWKESQNNSDFSKSDQAMQALSASPFLGLAVLTLSESGGWHSSVALNRSNHFWFLNGVNGDLLTKLPLAKTDSNKLVWSRVEGAGRRPFLLSLSSVKLSDGNKGIVLGLLPLQYFSEITAKSSAGENEIIVANDQGFAFAYPEQRYVGANMKEQPLFSLSHGQRSPSGVGSYNEGTGDSFVGAYESIAGTNLTLFVRTPASVGGGAIAAIQGSLLFYTMLIGLVMTALLLIATLPWTRAVDYLSGSVEALADGQPIRLPTQQMSRVMGLRKAFEKLQGQAVGIGEVSGPKLGFTVDEQQVIMRSVSTGVMQLIKAPVTVILGHVQMARAKVSDEEVKQHLTVVEREARQVRNSIERMSDSVETPASEFKSVDIRDVVLEALAMHKGEMVNIACEVVKKLPDAAMVKVDRKQLLFVIEQVLKNALASMKAVAEPKLTIRLELSDELVALRIVDNGEGMNQQTLSRAFEPYYSKDNETPGIGLSVSLGIIKSFSGEIDILSKEGDGAEVVIELPLADKARAITQPEVSVEEALDVPESREATEKSAVQPPEGGEVVAPSLDEILDEEEYTTIGGKSPLTGSRAHDLPQTPAFDEVTLAGAKAIDEDGQLLEDEDEDDDDEFQVSIRAPKVRGKK